MMTLTSISVLGESVPVMLLSPGMGDGPTWLEEEVSIDESDCVAVAWLKDDTVLDRVLVCVETETENTETVASPLFATNTSPIAES